MKRRLPEIAASDKSQIYDDLVLLLYMIIYDSYILITVHFCRLNNAIPLQGKLGGLASPLSVGNNYQ